MVTKYLSEHKTTTAAPSVTWEQSETASFPPTKGLVAVRLLSFYLKPKGGNHTFKGLKMIKHNKQNR